MKEVLFVIRTNMYAKTKEALAQKGFFAFTSKEVLGRGRENVQFEIEQGTEEKEIVQPTLVAKRLMIVWVCEEQIEELISTIIDVNQTNHTGDGKIFVSPVADGIRIRTGEKGNDVVL